MEWRGYNNRATASDGLVTIQPYVIDSGDYLPNGKSYVSLGNCEDYTRRLPFIKVVNGVEQAGSAGSAPANAIAATYVMMVIGTQNGGGQAVLSNLPRANTTLPVTASVGIFASDRETRLDGADVADPTTTGFNAGGSVRLYGAGVGCRSLAVTARTGLVSRRVELREVATSEPDIRMFASAADQLSLRVKGTKTAEGGCTLEATVADEAKPPRPRALDMRLVVEKPLAGWSWHATWRRDETIAGDCVFRNDHNAGGHPVSSYPFTAVSKDGPGFVVAMPIDRPAYESRVVTTNGIVSSVAVGLLARPAGSPAPQSAPNGVTLTLRSWQTAVYALAPAPVPTRRHRDTR